MRRGASAGSSLPFAASTTTTPWPFARAASIPVLIAAPTPRRRSWLMTLAPAARASSGPPSSEPSSTTMVSAIIGGTRSTRAAIAWRSLKSGKIIATVPSSGTTALYETTTARARSSRELANRVLLQEAAVVDVQRGLRAVGELELAEDVRDVCLHGALADPQRRGDLLVRAAARHELQDLALARGEVAVPLVVPGRAVAAAEPPELVEHAFRHRWVDEREAVGDGADGVRELAARHLLQEIPRRAGADRAEHKLVLVVVGEDDHPRGRHGIAHAPRRGHPVPVAHLDVHQDHVGEKLLRDRERLVPVARLAHDLDLRFGLEDRAQAASNERVIVGDEDADLADFRHRPKSLPRKLAFSVRSRSSIAPRWSVSSTVSVQLEGAPSTVTR